MIIAVLYSTMERCQGLPDRPCPDSRCDATVKNTIYDLFLCRQCELKRDAAKTSASSAVTGGSATVGATAADPQHVTDSAAEVFAGADEPVVGKKTRRRQPARLGSAGRLTSTGADNNTAVSDNTSEIRQLKDEVCRLNSHISMLTTKLNFVLSFLQLNDQPDYDSAYPPLTTSAVAGNEISSQPDHLSANSVSTTDNKALQTHQLYSSALQSNNNTFNFRQAAVAAVYNDQRERESRSNSVIISGLPTRDCSDKQSVIELFDVEFNLHTEVAHCKRLGQPMPGKIQPLLIVFRNVDEAKLILSNAKRLRQSTDKITRDQVYINPHLTKAEARAAFERRCQRRHLAQQKSNRLASATALTVQHDSVPPITFSASTALAHSLNEPAANQSVMNDAPRSTQMSGVSTMTFNTSH